MGSSPQGCRHRSPEQRRHHYGESFTAGTSLSEEELLDWQRAFDGPASPDYGPLAFGLAAPVDQRLTISSNDGGIRTRVRFDAFRTAKL